MRILLLGTGAADGLPNPFCRCITCQDARERGQVRMRSSALVDGQILIDPGPDVPQAIARAGRDLHDAREWLITHGHPDHLDPLLLLLRDWVLPHAPLTIRGPRAAIDRLTHWLSPTGNVRLEVATPGDVADVDVDGTHYRLTAHRADHRAPQGPADDLADEALLWSIESGNARFLYATDTGPKPQISGGPFDLVALDETFGPKSDHATGHLDFHTMPQLLKQWRSEGVIDERTRIAATHIGHHNPPLAELRKTLRSWEMDVYDDGTELDTGGHVADIGEHTQHSTTLITGGMRSGKSYLAEQLAGDYESVTYVATARLREDPEWSERISRHRQRRPSHWQTVETADPTQVLREATANHCVLIDCLSLWLTHRLDDLDAWNRLDDRVEIEKAITDDIATLAESIVSCAADVICVTNEVGMTLVSTDPGARLFTDLLGKLNARLSAQMSTVLFVVAGRALELPTPTHRRPS